MTPDIINGIVSGAYGLTVLHHCWNLWKSRQTRGTSLFSLAAGFAVCGTMAVTFWTSALWWSFFGNLVIMASNVTWIALVIYFRQMELAVSIGANRLYFKKETVFRENPPLEGFRAYPLYTGANPPPAITNSLQAKAIGIEALTRSYLLGKP